MVNTAHPTLDELRAWRRGAIEGDDVLAIGRHLGTCDHCRSAATERLGLDDVAGVLCDDIVQLEVAPPARKPRALRWLALAASVAVIAEVGLRTTSRMSHPSESKPRALAAQPVLNDEHAKLLAEIRAGGSIGVPSVLRALRTQLDVLRGSGQAPAALSPSGVVVTDDRPLFFWPASPGARSTVHVYQGDRDVMDSGVLATSQWRPAQPLSRGVTYTWDVRVEKDGIAQILPSSPAPVARFHVLDAAKAATLERVSRDHPGDPLLLGILEARAGLDAEARAQLRLVVDPQDAAVAQRLLREMDRWPAR
jgi:hypothetical protein